MEGRNYQIVNTLATGGTAVLYKAIQTSLDREVVIKKLHSHLISDRNFTSRFELEAKAAASLDHENIVRIIDSGASKENYYIVMEYIDGMTLKEILEKNGKLDEETTLLIAREICMGLDHAHQRGIVHRDIKPANIMITREGQVKITDFGLAKLRQSSLQQTMADTLVGTPLYMSPEQAIGEGLDGRSDLFSLGTVCYELITGRQPFLGNNYAAVIQNIINGSLPSISRIMKGADPEADSIVMKALSREPGKRYRTALEMARAIETALGQEKILGSKERFKRLVAGGGVARKARPASSPSAGKRRSFIPAAIAASIVALSALYLYMNPEMTDIVGERIRVLRTSRPAPAGKNLMTGSHGPASTVLPQPQVVFVDTLPEAGISEDPPAASTVPVTAEDNKEIDGTYETTAGPLTVSSPGPGSDDAADGSENTISAVEPAGTQSVAGGPADGPEKEPAEEKTLSDQDSRDDFGFIDIRVEPEAEILVDNVYRTSGNRYGPVEIEPGVHRVTCRQKDFIEYNETVTITRGELSRRRIYLKQMSGQLLFVTEPGIRVFVNGKFIGITPLSSPVRLTSGRHLVDMKKVGFKDWSNEVFIPSEETVTLRITLTEI